MVPSAGVIGGGATPREFAQDQDDLAGWERGLVPVSASEGVVNLALSTGVQCRFAVIAAAVDAS